MIITFLNPQKQYLLTANLSKYLLMLMMVLQCAQSTVSHAKRDNSARQKAFTLMSEGRAKFDAEQYKEAIQLWRQAYDTYQDNKLLLFIASTYARVPNACLDEEKAWTSYLSACKESACPNKERGLKRYNQFFARCYITVTFDSAAPKASVSYQGDEWGPLPHKRDLLMNEYSQVKISAPGYLSEYIDLKLNDPTLRVSVPTGGESKPVNQTELNVSLTKIPPETFFEKHQLKIALTTAVVGVSILSIGSLQLSSASTLSDEVSNQNYPDEFTSMAQKQSFMDQYQKDKDRFESNQIWGAILLTAGVATLGTGVWILLYQGPNTTIFERARRQGDLAQSMHKESDKSQVEWSISPMGSSRHVVDGVQGSWKINF